MITGNANFKKKSNVNNSDFSNDRARKYTHMLFRKKL